MCVADSFSLIPHWWYVCHSWFFHWHKWRNACHIVRETVLVTSAKRFDFDCLKIPPDVKLSWCISDENVCRIASKRNRASAVVSECKQCQAVTAKCLPCAWTLSNTANTHKQNCHLQSRMLHKYMNAACRSNIRVQHNETDFVKYELEQTQISNTHCQITADHHHWL